jgi:proteasome lid subunit RPN8/RPN11
MIDVDPTLAPLVIDGRVLNEMCAHALETWPEECCGLVTGKGPGSHQSVHRCRNDMTLLHRGDPVGHPRDGRAAFHMNESDALRACREAGRAGEQVTAVYHSHVGAGAGFSQLDQEFASDEVFPFPDADHIVIALAQRGVRELALFRRDASRGFVGRAIVAGAP